MKFKTLSALLPIDSMRQTAWDETCDLTERHDVPKGDDVPPDLRDIIGFFRNTKNGYRISGRLLPSDLLQGSPSSSIPLFLTFAAVLGAVGIIMGGLGEWTRYVIFPVSVVYLILLGIVGGFVMALITFLVFVMAMGGSFIPGASLPPSVSLGISFGQNFGVFLLALMPLLYELWIRHSRIRKLAERGTTIAHESLGEFSESHVAARKIQAENAMKDDSPFIKLGVAMGSFHHVQDPYSPDPGLPMGLTCQDLSTHMVVFGATGTGKTSGVLRPVANAYLDSGYGGAIVLDGKGQLAEEFRNRPNYVFIEPGSSPLALLEGLEPADIVQAVVSLHDGSGSGSGENNSFFVSSGQQMLLSAAVIAFEMERAVPEKYPLTFEFLYVLLDRLSNKEQAQKYSDYLKSRASGNYLLADAIQYFDVKLPQMDERTRSNVLAVCTSWLSPIMSHPKIREWAKLSKGADVTICLRGGVVGVNVPASEYGEAGKLITALVKARIFRAIRKRPSNWKENGSDMPILMVVDEAQAVVGRMELDVFPVARSLGLMGLYATQSIDEFMGKFGKDQALALLNNFRSFVIFSTSEATYQWAMSRIGTSTVSQPKANTLSADAAFGAQLAAGSPVFDRDHPNRKQMRVLARDGVGGLWSVAKSGLAIVLGNTAIDLDYETHVESHEAPILTPARAEANLATPFQAVAQVMRGGVKRRDVIKVTPSFNTSSVQYGGG